MDLDDGLVHRRKKQRMRGDDKLPEAVKIRKTVELKEEEEERKKKEKKKDEERRIA